MEGAELAGSMMFGIGGGLAGGRGYKVELRQSLQIGVAMLLDHGLQSGPSFAEFLGYVTLEFYLGS